MHRAARHSLAPDSFVILDPVPPDDAARRFPQLSPVVDQRDRQTGAPVGAKSVEEARTPQSQGRPGRHDPALAQSHRLLEDPLLDDVVGDARG